MTLHVTNGDSAGDTLKLIFPGDRVLCWRDVVDDIPKREEWAAQTAILRGEWEEIVLWFEHDLYDQLQLLELLDLLHEQNNVSLINHNDYLGPMTPEALAALYPTRRRVTVDEYREARRTWAAFRAPEPHGMTEFRVFDRFCEEYPAVEDGCSRTERFILRTLAAGYRDDRVLFREFSASEEPKWMGDLRFFEILAGLKSGPAPLVNELNQVTAKGRAVLEGRDDRILANGPDVPWRWDRMLRRFQAGRTS